MFANIFTDFIPSLVKYEILEKLHKRETFKYNLHFHTGRCSHKVYIQ